MDNAVAGILARFSIFKKPSRFSPERIHMSGVIQKIEKKNVIISINIKRRMLK